MSQLHQLRAMTSVVADTGDLDSIVKYQPEDATTNPSLVLKAAQLPRYQPIVNECIELAGLKVDKSPARLGHCLDLLSVKMAREISALIPGRVSIEVDARLSFDKEATITRARQLISMLKAQGVGTERVLIKIAATWEGIQAARELEAEGIQCNLTLIFGFAQAAACADAGVFLISPFVGRILDWHKANTKRDDYSPEEDPGVLSVKSIYQYYKQHDYSTVVMGASFRNIGEIQQLAGCDKLTISPALLEELSVNESSLERILDPLASFKSIPKQIETESEFRWSMNQDAMATEKLAEGIRNFTADQVRLEELLVDLAYREAS